MAIAISSPPEYNVYIYRDAQLDFVMHGLEEYGVYNIEEKEQMIMRDGELSTMIKNQEDYKSHKLMEK